jgi:hypothetical protein
MPRKPTSPYGYISFSKKGKVQKVTFSLSHKKTEQERSVAEVFIRSFNEQSSIRIIENLIPLSPNDHDFQFNVNNKATLLQVTELVEREFIFPLTMEEYKKSACDGYIQKDDSLIPWGIDFEKKNNALLSAIKKKIDMHYACDETKDLWLLVFTTSQFYETEYISGGKIQISEALARARKYCQQRDMVFKEIWFTNLLTRSVQIWPMMIDQL